MADKVDVVFGADTSGIRAGGDEVNAQLRKIQQSVDGLTGFFEGLTKGIAEAFTVEKLGEFIEKMGQLGLSIERSMAMIGGSSQEIVQLMGVARLTGTSFESLQNIIERISLGVQKSTRDAFNPQAQALHNLGINAKQFIDLPLMDRFDALAAAVSKFNPSLNLTNNLMAIGGRGVAQMLPMLLQGAEGFKHFKEEIDHASQGLAQAAPGMAATHEKLTLLGLSLQSLGARIFTVLKPAIDAAIELFTKWVQSISSENIVAAVNAVADWMIRAIQAIAEFVKGLGDVIDTVKKKIEELIGPLKELDEWAKAALKRIGIDLAGAGGDFENRWKDATTNSLRQVGTWEAGVIKAINAVRDSANKLTLPPAEVPTGGKDAPPVNYGAAKASQDAMAQAQRDIAAIEQAYQLAAENINHTFKMSLDFFGSAEAQKTSALLSAIAQRESAEIAVLDALQARYARGSAEYAKIEDEKTKIHQKALLDRTKAENAAAEASWQRWKGVADSMASTFASGISSMVTGGKTLSQAMAQITRGLIDNFISMVTKMAFEWIAKQLFMSTASKAVQATDVAGHVAAESAKTAATGAGVAARTGAEATGAATNIFSQIGQAVAFIFTQAAKTFAGVFAFLSPVMGPAAVGPAAGSEATVMAQAAMLPAAAVGTDYVLKTGLALIHKGEEIKPADVGPAYSGANSGGVTVPITIVSWDGRSVQSYLNSGGDAVIGRAVAKHLNLNPSSRSKF